MEQNNNNVDEKINILIAHAVASHNRLDSIDANLTEHMRRTEAAEERLEFIEDEVKPMLEHFKGLKWAVSALLALSAILKILDYLKI